MTQTNKTVDVENKKVKDLSKEELKSYLYDVIKSRIRIIMPKRETADGDKQK